MDIYRYIQIIMWTSSTKSALLISDIHIQVRYLFCCISYVIQTCVLREWQQTGVNLRPKLWIKCKQNRVITPHQTLGLCVKEIALPQHTHTHKLCSLAGCVTWILLSVLLLIPVGNGCFCVCPMGRWFVVDWSRTSQSGPFVYPTQRDQPMWPPELMAVCSHWGNTGHISEKASETQSQVLISDGYIVAAYQPTWLVVGGCDSFFLAVEVKCTAVSMWH